MLSVIVIIVGILLGYGFDMVFNYKIQTNY